MLKTRIYTAIVMLAVFLSALFLLPLQGWAIFALLLLTAAAWEWARLIRLCGTSQWIYTIAISGVCAALWLLFPDEGVPVRSASIPVYTLASAFWLIMVPLWLWRAWMPDLKLMMLTGVIVLVPTWLALVQLRAIGTAPLLMLMAVVWISDVAAYFAGRRFGRRKLAASISPGKTWEGVAGAMCAVSAYGAVWITSGNANFPQIFGALAMPALWMIFLLWVLAAVGIYGDLFESSVKRRAGLKDSGVILPGHGGMLDRIDALTSALPVAALVYLL